MSQGSLVQVVAKGAQDDILYTKDLKSTNINYHFPKITNYTIGDHELIFMNKVDFGTTSRVKIDRLGDLLWKTYIVVTLPELDIQNLKKKENDKTYKIRWADYPAIALIKKINLYIGGSLIDSQSGEFIYAWNDLTDNNYDKMFFLGQDYSLHIPKDSHEGEKLYIPLSFWFTYELRQALPLIALQYHEVEIEVEFNNFNDCIIVLEGGRNTDKTHHFLKHSDAHFENLHLQKSSLLCTYVYLTLEERKAFAQNEHEYLIMQIQMNENNHITSDTKINMDFNHPVKMLIWTLQSLAIKKEGEYFNYSATLEYFPKNFSTTDFDKYLEENIAYYPKILPKLISNTTVRYHLLDEAKISLNGHDKLSYRDYKYYCYVQPFQHQLKYNDSYTYMYSFAYDPKLSIPVSTCNFSRIDNAFLHVKTNNKFVNKENPVNLNVYGIGYNILKIKSGMAGLQFSN